MPLIHVEVSDDVEDYLREWADAVGCEVHEVAGDALHQYVEEHAGEE